MDFKHSGGQAQQQSGFTLIELVVVIAVVAALGGVAVPKFLDITKDARKTVNEQAAIGALRTLVTAQELFRDEDRDGNGVADYAESLSALASAGLIDPNLESGQKQGYVFSVAPSTSQFQWNGNSEPASRGKSGDRSFFVDETGVIRVIPCPPGYEPELSPSGKVRCVKQKLAVIPAEDTAGTAAIDAANLLGAGQALPLAKAMSAELSALLPAAFDADGDSRLALSELLDADLLTLARNVAAGLPPIPGGDIVVGDDAELAALLTRFQARLRRDLDLQPSEAEPPAVPICGLEVNIAPALELASPSLPFAALSVLRDGIAALDPSPAAGEMTDTSAKKNARHQSSLISTVDRAFALLRSGKVAQVTSALEQIRGRADGAADPEDWVAGIAAAELRQAIDDAQALILLP